MISHPALVVLETVERRTEESGPLIPGTIVHPSRSSNETNGCCTGTACSREQGHFRFDKPRLEESGMRFDLPWQLQSASARATYIRWTMDVRQSTEIKYVVSRKDQWTCIPRQPSTWRPFFFQTLCLANLHLSLDMCVTCLPRLRCHQRWTSNLQIRQCVYVPD